MSADVIARGLGAQARAASNALAVLPRARYDGSIVALGDSITANSLSYATTGGTTDSWLTKGVYAMLIARAGGRLRPVRIAGWPFQNGSITGSIVAVLVARGGSGYSAATTLTASNGGGTLPTLTPIIANGVITGVNIVGGGNSNTQSPQIAVADTGGGSGAVLTAITAGTGNYAVGGIDTPQMEAFVPLILNNGSPVARNVLFMGGTNNSPHGISLADTKASILSICQRLTAGGVRVIAIAPLDRSDANGASARQSVFELRRWFVDQLTALVPGVAVVDPTPYLTDPNLDVLSSSTSGMPVAYTSDGLHPSSLGADIIAKLVWAQIAGLFPCGGYLSAGNKFSDVYNATYQPTGNLLTQSFTRTGTSAAGDAPVTPNATGEAPWTGTRGVGIFLTRLSGGTGAGTVAASQEVRSDGRLGTRQVLTVNVTGAAQGETYRLIWTTNGTSVTLGVQGANTLQVGDTIRGAIDEATMSNVVGLRGMKLRLVANDGSALTPTAATVVTSTGIKGTAAWGDYEDANYPAWSGDTLFLQTRELVLGASAYGVTMHLDFVVNAGAASFTAKLYGASVRKIV